MVTCWRTSMENRVSDISWAAENMSLLQILQSIDKIFREGEKAVQIPSRLPAAC